MRVPFPPSHVRFDDTFDMLLPAQRAVIAKPLGTEGAEYPVIALVPHVIAGLVELGTQPWPTVGWRAKADLWRIGREVNLLRQRTADTCWDVRAAIRPLERGEATSLGLQDVPVIILWQADHHGQEFCSGYIPVTATVWRAVHERLLPSEKMLFATVFGWQPRTWGAPQDLAFILNAAMLRMRRAGRPTVASHQCSG